MKIAESAKIACLAKIAMVAIVAKKLLQKSRKSAQIASLQKPFFLIFLLISQKICHIKMKFQLLSLILRKNNSKR